MEGIPDSILDVTPAMLPPPGQVSNFVNPPDLLVLSIIVACTSLGVAVVFYSIRLFVKLFLLRKLYPEDYVCGLSICVFGALAADISTAALQGSSRHQWNVSLGQAIHISYTAYWGEIVFCVAICLAKIAIIQQIRRIFAAGTKGPLYHTCTLLMWVNGCFYTAASLAGIFSCTPRPAAWDPFTSGVCIDKMMLIVISSGINVLSDVIILVIPVWCVWHLVLPLKKKLALGAVFLTGVFSLSMAVLKLYITIPLLTTEDLTYTINLTGLSACAETSSAIIVGCLPCLPRFLQFLRNRPSRSSAGSPFRTPTNWSYRYKRKASPKFSSSGYSYYSDALEKTALELGAVPPAVQAKEISPTSPVARPGYHPPPTSWMSPPSVVGEEGDEEITALPPLVTSFSRPAVPQPAVLPLTSRHQHANTLPSPLSGETIVMEDARGIGTSPPAAASRPSVVTSLASNTNTPPFHSTRESPMPRGPSRGISPISHWPSHEMSPVSAWPSHDSSSPPTASRGSRQGSVPARRQSLSELASSPASQRAMHALAGRYWVDREVDEGDDRERHVARRNGSTSTRSRNASAGDAPRRGSRR